MRSLCDLNHLPLGPGINLSKLKTDVQNYRAHVVHDASSISELRRKAALKLSGETKIVTRHVEGVEGD